MHFKISEFSLFSRVDQVAVYLREDVIGESLSGYSVEQ